jgi:hypothetical protein
MNERIKELAEQYASENRPGSFVKYDPEWFVFYNKKFAELMIVEFTEAVKQTATRIAQTGFNDGLSAEEVNKRVNSALYVLEVMRERFGVEDAPVDDVDRILRTVRTRG